MIANFVRALRVPDRPALTVDNFTSRRNQYGMRPGGIPAVKPATTALIDSCNITFASGNHARSHLARKCGARVLVSIQMRNQ